MMTRVSLRRRFLAALLVASAGALGSAQATELVVNGSFEANGGAGSATFSGWTAFSQPGSQGGFLAQTGTTPPLTPFAVPAPPAGNFAAMSDQPGPGTHVLYQDISIPAGVPALLSARVFVLNQAEEFATPADLDFNTMPNQQARFDIATTAAAPQDIGAGVLQNLFRTEVGDPPMGGYIPITADVSAYAGQTIRLRFAETDNRQGLNFGIDLVSLIVPSPPTITKEFGAPAIAVNGTTTLTFTLENPDSQFSMAGIAFVDTLPAGLAVSTPNGLTGSCGGGTITATDGSQSISLSGATLAASASCSFSVSVTGTAAGVAVNNVQASSTIGGAGNTSSASVTVVGPPVIGKAFGAPSIPLNGMTSLSFTLQNNNATVALTGVGFSDTLPAGLVIATPNGLSGSCGGGTITATQGANAISLSGATLAASTSCTFSIDVTGIAAGAQNNATGNVGSANGSTGGTASASIAVVAPPTIAKAFTPSTIFAGGPTTLTFTLTNPAANTVALTGVAFSDVLPAGLAVATASSPVCGGTLTTAGPGTIALSGAMIAVGGVCQFSVTVFAVSTGDFTNITGIVTSANGGSGDAGATASARLTVLPTRPIPTLSEWAFVLLAGMLLLAGLGSLRKRHV